MGKFGTAFPLKKAEGSEQPGKYFFRSGGYEFSVEKERNVNGFDVVKTDVRQGG